MSRIRLSNKQAEFQLADNPDSRILGGAQHPLCLQDLSEDKH